MVRFVAALALAVVAYGAWQDYDATSVRATTQAAQMARAVEIHAVRSLDFIRTMLDHIAATVDGTDPTTLDDEVRRHLLEEMAVFRTMFVDSAAWLVDAEGRVVAGQPDGPAVAPDADLFAAIRDGGALEVGGPVVGPGGRLFFCVARRIDGANGGLAGIVVAGVDIGQFEASFTSLSLGPGATAGLVHVGSRQLLARFPFLSEDEGRSVAGSVLFDHPLGPSASGTFTTVSQLDGVERHFAFRRLADYPLVATIGVPTRPLLIQWAGRQVWTGAVAVLLAALVVVLGGRVIRATRATTRANERLTSALSDRTLLLAEVHHRVKNNLQIIQSLLTMESLTVPPEARSGYEDSLQRIQAMGMVHELLYQSGDFGAVRCKEYLVRLCGLLVGDHPAVSLTVEGDEALLDIDRAVPFAMAVTEIVSNALKHAFPDGRDGTLAVGLDHSGGRMTVTVADDGIGLPPGFQPGRSTSLGTRLLQGLADQLGGTVAFESDGGTTVRLSFPLV